MYYSIFPTATTYLSSGSHPTTGESQKDQNFGGSEVLEIKKVFQTLDFNYQTRALVKFDLNETNNSISQSIVEGKIPSPVGIVSTPATYHLRLFETEGNKNLSEEFTLSFHPISQSWQQGFGKSFDDPKNTEGASWTNRNSFKEAAAVSWSNATVGLAMGGSHLNISHSAQSFDRTSSPDIDVDITDMVEAWLTNKLDNHGILIRFSGSQETNASTFGHLNYFSKETNTVYAPRLEVRWDDHKVIAGSNTGSLNELTMSGNVDNLLYIKGLRDKYRETEKARFRVGARKRYIQKNIFNICTR